MEHGADVNVKNSSGWTPLHYAALWDNLEIAKLLWEHGADPTLRNEKGKTPLDIAIEKGSKKVTKFLKEHNTERAGRYFD